MRHFRGSRGIRRRSLGNVVQSYKKIIFRIAAGFSAGFQNEQIVLGVDSVAAGQTSATDPNVPTGSLIKYIDIQFAVSNLVSTPCYINCSIQYVLSGQTTVDPNLAGGHAQRNQILHMEMYSIGADQNSNHKFRFKVPPKFQRLREGMSWHLTWRNSATVNRQMQAIYKFYR